MTTLRHALDRIKPAMIPTSRYVNPAAAYANGRLSAYNGTVFAQFPIDLDLPPFHCGSTKLDKVVTADTRMSVGKDRLTLLDAKARFSLMRLPDDQIFELPRVDGEPHMVTVELVEAAQRIANFASTNAVHPWANCVTLTRNDLIATNNVALARTCMDVGIEMTCPLGLIEQLNSGQILRADAMVSLTEPDGLVLQYHRLATEAPTQVLTMAKSLIVCHDPIDDFADILTKLDCIDAQTMTMTNREIRVTANDGDEGTHPFTLDWDDGVEFKTSMEAARLLARFGSRVDARECPGKLFFAGDNLFGVMAGRSG